VIYVVRVTKMNIFISQRYAPLAGIYQITYQKNSMIEFTKQDMKSINIKKCFSCARQIVSYTVSIDDKYCCNRPATSMGFGQWCCKECSKELDENGLFLEERI
jgi:hypothetical protein